MIISCHRFVLLLVPGALRVSLLIPRISSPAQPCLTSSSLRWKFEVFVILVTRRSPARKTCSPGSEFPPTSDPPNDSRFEHRQARPSTFACRTPLAVEKVVRLRYEAIGEILDYVKTGLGKRLQGRFRESGKGQLRPQYHYHETTRWISGSLRAGGNLGATAFLLPPRAIFLQRFRVRVFPLSEGDFGAVHTAFLAALFLTSILHFLSLAERLTFHHTLFATSSTALSLCSLSSCHPRRLPLTCFSLRSIPYIYQSF